MIDGFEIQKRYENLPHGNNAYRLLKMLLHLLTLKKIMNLCIFLEVTL